MEIDAFIEVKDSGTRESFETGSKRDTREGKGRFDLITPFAMFRLARHYENGAKKYDDRNWEKGQPIMRYWDSANRHMWKWLQNNLSGNPQDEDHLAAALWNLAAMIDHEERIQLGLLPPELNDIPGPIYKFGPEKETT